MTMPMKVAGDDIHIPSSPLEVLSTRVAAAAPLASPEEVLGALVRLDPVAAAVWLSEHATALEDTDAGVVNRMLREVLPIMTAAGSAEALKRLLPLFSGCAGLDPGPVGEAAEALVASDAHELRPVFEAMVERGSSSAGLLRALAAVREADGDVPGTHELLTRLVFAEPSASTVRSVQRWRSRLAPAGGAPVRAAVLGSFTLDLVVGCLDAECRALGLAPDIYTAPFNSWEREAIDPGSGFRRFDADVAFLAAALDDLAPALAGGIGAEVVAAAGAEAVDRVIAAAEQITSWFGGVLVVHGLYSAYGDPLGIAASAADSPRSLWIAQLNQELAERLRGIPRTYLLDVQDVLLRRAGGPLDHPKMRHFAKLRFTPEGAAHLAHVYAGYIAAAKGLTRKCVVVDLDNTLWGGVIGEDGMHGIRLGTNAPGVEYLDLQRHLHSLASRGVLLAIASKNNPEDAMGVIRDHPAMVLREEAFAAMQINWQPKPENLRQIARDLNIGLDALVFLDDNPSERALMRQALPEVLTPELPRDPALYRGVVEALPQLQTLVVTDEDRVRSELYRAQRQREAVRVQTTSLDDYLRSLEIEVSVAVDDPYAAHRLHQLLQRTNQFNLTTRRHAAAALSAWMQDPAWRIYSLKARDRYGDHGLSAAAIVHFNGGEWIIDSLLMSCRVISYGIESALLASIVEDAAAAGAATVRGEFISTAKNAPARDFYVRHGFAEARTEGELQVFELDLNDSQPECPNWIRLERLQ